MSEKIIKKIVVCRNITYKLSKTLKQNRIHNFLSTGLNLRFIITV